MTEPDPRCHRLPQTGPVVYKTPLSRPKTRQLWALCKRIGGLETEDPRTATQTTGTRSSVRFDPSRQAWLGEDDVPLDATVAAELDPVLERMSARIAEEVTALTTLHRHIASRPRRFLDEPPPPPPPLAAPLSKSRRKHDVWLRERVRSGAEPPPEQREPLLRRFGTVASMLADLPRPADCTLRLDPASTDREVVADLVMPKSLQSAGIAVTVIDHRLEIDANGLVEPTRHRLAIARSHAAALAVGLGLFWADRGTELRVRFLEEQTEADVPDTTIGEFHIGTGHWLDALDALPYQDAWMFSTLPGIALVDPQE